MAISTLPLNGLRAFEAAARHLSFTKAAEELHVTPAAISHQIRALEERLGHELFVRHHKVLDLSAAGRLLLPGLRDGFVLLERAVARLSVLRTDNRLVVTCAPTLAARWLLPRLEGFQNAYPEIEVHLNTSYRVVDLEGGSTDVALRYGSGHYPGLHAEALFEEGMTPVCSPALLEGAHPLREPGDLVHHTLLHDDSWGFIDTAPDWNMWLRAAGVEGVDTSRGPHFDVAVMAISAAVLGRGVALTTRSLVADDLVSGRLVAPFDLELTFNTRVFFVCLPESLERPSVSAFRDWVVRMAEETVHPPAGDDAA